MGRNLEAYVDDMVIKSKIELEMIKDVEETLLTLKKVNMKLNPKKCSFGMEEVKFLGYIVTFEGIRANLEKTKAVVNMPSPSNLKQMQWLSDKLDALNRFLSKAEERALPCLDTLKKSPKKEEELMVYLSAANEAVSVVLLVERDRRQTQSITSNNDAKYEAPLAEGLGIKLVSTSVYHPQANEAVERANRSIMQGIKTRLHQEGGTWVEEFPNVLWAHRTTPKTSNGETPFSLAYGTEAVIPAEIGIPTRRVIQESDERNKETLRLNLNLLEEQREIATIRETRRKQQVEKYYNQRVHHKQFKVGEFFLRKNKLSKVENTCKLRPKWEGPYEVVETYGTGTYKVLSMDGAEIPRT
ncbi:reverse transcriptase domain-containing protein [Tanacetum coccineum]